MIKKLWHHFVWMIKGISVLALVGRSGTGKSFRAKLVADRHGVDIIVDDGLLISNDEVVAGHSAKMAPTPIAAVRVALFDKKADRVEAIKALSRRKFKRILILGTSPKMVNRIAKNLDLPVVEKIIYINEIASEEEIKLAMKTRLEGKHVIPVPSIEVRRDYPNIFYDSVRVLLKKGIGLINKPQVYEKAIVRPAFAKKGTVSISEAALTQMVLHCTEEFDSGISILKVHLVKKANGYSLTIHVKLQYGQAGAAKMHQLRSYILNSIEKHTGINFTEVNLLIKEIS